METSDLYVILRFRGVSYALRLVYAVPSVSTSLVIKWKLLWFVGLFTRSPLFFQLVTTGGRDTGDSRTVRLMVPTVIAFSALRFD